MASWAMALALSPNSTCLDSDSVDHAIKLYMFLVLRLPARGLSAEEVEELSAGLTSGGVAQARLRGAELRELGRCSEELGWGAGLGPCQEMDQRKRRKWELTQTALAQWAGKRMAQAARIDHNGA
ncbi:hypothetical protein FF1_008335 [Malus domestica]